MATTKKLNDFIPNALDTQESSEVKGGKTYVPNNTGSMGYINWDEVVIRGNGMSTSPSQNLVLGIVGNRK